MKSSLVEKAQGRERLSVRSSFTTDCQTIRRWVMGLPLPSLVNFHFSFYKIKVDGNTLQKTQTPSVTPRATTRHRCLNDREHEASWSFAGTTDDDWSSDSCCSCGSSGSGFGSGWSDYDCCCCCCWSPDETKARVLLLVIQRSKELQLVLVVMKHK